MTTFGAGRLDLRKGDCLEIMDSLAPNSVDSIVCDPPYHLLSAVKRFGGANAAAAKEGTDGLLARASRGFMGKEWDGGDIAFRPETWAKAFRVLKPGGHLVAFSAPRCQHRMVCAIEDAGFEIRDGLMWLFGMGFPKSLDVSKAIDKDAGFWRGRAGSVTIAEQHSKGTEYERTDKGDPITADATKWAGFGTALKPAYEPICLARKPIEGTVAANVLAHGVGALNIDGCRVESTEVWAGRDLPNAKDGVTWGGTLNASSSSSSHPLGRWPANIVTDGSEEVVSMFPSSKSSQRMGILGEFSGQDDVTRGHDDSGSAARFFYSAKASKHDRANSKHPTVKPVSLMRWLCKLVTPPGGLVLDPFAGSGTTGAAAHLEGFRAILCECEAEYQIDIENRLRELCGEDPPWLSIETPPWLKLREAAE